jgi:predicted O-methyltransferase YrrM
MEHFYESIPGWFSYDYLYKDAVDRAEDGAVFVEIGSFKGRSTAFMAVEIANSGKKIQFDCVDPQELLSHYAESAKEQPEVFEGYNETDFHRRLEPVKGYYNLVKEKSSTAANRYSDGTIDFLMIDGDHSYEAVKEDILNFLPKMKVGGVITGDDAFTEDIQRAARDAVEGTGLTVEFIHGIHFWIEITE